MAVLGYKPCPSGRLFIRELTNHVPEQLGHGPATSGGGSAELCQLVGSQAHLESLSPGQRARLPLRCGDMKQRYRYRLYPHPHQQMALAKAFGC